MNPKIIPNRYAGICACGENVEAGAGVYVRGIGLRCSADLSPTIEGGSAHACPNQIADVRRHREHLLELRRNAQATEPTTPEGVCGKCGGTGKYRYADGEIGVCYPCEGSGKV